MPSWNSRDDASFENSSGMNTPAPFRMPSFKRDRSNREGSNQRQSNVGHCNSNLSSCRLSLDNTLFEKSSTTNPPAPFRMQSFKREHSEKEGINNSRRQSLDSMLCEKPLTTNPPAPFRMPSFKRASSENELSIQHFNVGYSRRHSIGNMSSENPVGINPQNPFRMQSWRRVERRELITEKQSNIAPCAWREDDDIEATTCSSLSTCSSQTNSTPTQYFARYQRCTSTSLSPLQKKPVSDSSELAEIEISHDVQKSQHEWFEGDDIESFLLKDKDQDDRLIL